MQTSCLDRESCVSERCVLVTESERAQANPLRPCQKTARLVSRWSANLKVRISFTYERHPPLPPGAQQAGTHHHRPPPTNRHAHPRSRHRCRWRVSIHRNICCRGIRDGSDSLGDHKPVRPADVHGCLSIDMLTRTNTLKLMHTLVCIRSMA